MRKLKYLQLVVELVHAAVAEDVDAHGSLDGVDEGHQDQEGTHYVRHLWKLDLKDQNG